MQTIGPYALRDLLGEGPAGRVWRAVDQQGSQVTMAVLGGSAANDPQRRWQFTTAVGQLAQTPGVANALASDMGATDPWVAYPDDGGATAARIFDAIGMPCPPVAMPVSGAPQPSTPQPSAPQPFAPQQPGPPQPGPQQPVSAQPMSVHPVSSQPDSAAPAPDPFQPVDPFNANAQISAAPVNPFEPHLPPGPETPEPFPPQPANDARFANESAPVQYQPEQRRFNDREPTPGRSRKGLLIGLVVVVVLLAGGVGGAVYFTGHSGTPDARRSASPAPTSAPSRPAPTKGGTPTPHTQQSAPSAPKQPGQEPPKDGSWPASFKTFGNKDKTRSLTGLAGLGFDLTVPEDWTCTKKDQSTTYVNYHCAGAKTKAGGDLIVRSCSEPCDPAKKIKMRQAEEAWGLRWVRDGGNSSYAQSTSVKQPGGGAGYGLVLVRYWHSKSGGPMDRQVVLRMTAPKAAADEVQKVANAVRDATQ